VYDEERPYEFTGDADGGGGLVVWEVVRTLYLPSDSKGCEVWTLMSWGAPWGLVRGWTPRVRRFLRMRQKARSARAARRTMPPTTPPTMGPTLEDFFGGGLVLSVGVGVGVDVGADVGMGMLLVVVRAVKEASSAK